METAPSTSAATKEVANSSHHAWECSKENVVPLKQGRRTRTLNSALQPTKQDQIKLRNEREELEREYLALDENNPDPLDFWDRYLKWTEENFPVGGNRKELQQLTYKIMGTFWPTRQQKYDYKDDPRYIKACFRNAQLGDTENEIKVYWNMFQNKIGVKNHELYRLWSEAHESKGDLKSANQVFTTNAVQYIKEDDTAFKKIKKDFDMRFARAMMGGFSTNNNDAKHTVDNDRRERPLENLRTFGAKKKVGSTRSTIGLGPVTVKQNPSALVSTKSTSNNNNNMSTGGKLQVFNDDDDDDNFHPPVGAPLPHDTRHGDELKENITDPSQWHGKKMKQSSAACVESRSVINSNQSTSGVTPSFTIYQEEEDAGPSTSNDKAVVSSSKMIRPRLSEFSTSSRRHEDNIENYLAEVKDILHSQQSATHRQLMKQNNDDVRPIRMYPVDKVYSPMGEFQLEEVWAARWKVKQAKKEKEEKERKERELREEKMKQDIMAAEEKARAADEKLKEREEQLRQLYQLFDQKQQQSNESQQTVAMEADEETIKDEAAQAGNTTDTSSSSGVPPMMKQSVVDDGEVTVCYKMLVKKLKQDNSKQQQQQMIAETSCATVEKEEVKVNNENDLHTDTYDEHFVFDCNDMTTMGMNEDDNHNADHVGNNTNDLIDLMFSSPTTSSANGNNSLQCSDYTRSPKDDDDDDDDNDDVIKTNDDDDTVMMTSSMKRHHLNDSVTCYVEEKSLKLSESFTEEQQQVVTSHNTDMTSQQNEDLKNLSATMDKLQVAGGGDDSTNFHDESSIQIQCASHHHSALMTSHKDESVMPPPQIGDDSIRFHPSSTQIFDKSNVHDPRSSCLDDRSRFHIWSNDATNTSTLGGFPKQSGDNSIMMQQPSLQASMLKQDVSFAPSRFDVSEREQPGFQIYNDSVVSNKSKMDQKDQSFAPQGFQIYQDDSIMSNKSRFEQKDQNHAPQAFQIYKDESVMSNKSRVEQKGEIPAQKGFQIYKDDSVVSNKSKFEQKDESHAAPGFQIYKDESMLSNKSRFELNDQSRVSGKQGFQIFKDDSFMSQANKSKLEQKDQSFAPQGFQIYKDDSVMSTKSKLMQNDQSQVAPGFQIYKDDSLMSQANKSKLGKEQSFAAQSKGFQIYKDESVMSNKSRFEQNDQSHAAPGFQIYNDSIMSNKSRFEQKTEIPAQKGFQIYQDESVMSIQSRGQNMRFQHDPIAKPESKESGFQIYQDNSMMSQPNTSRFQQSQQGFQIFKDDSVMQNRSRLDKIPDHSRVKSHNFGSEIDNVENIAPSGYNNGQLRNISSANILKDASGFQLAHHSDTQYIDIPVTEEDLRIRRNIISLIDDDDEAVQSDNHENEQCEVLGVAPTEAEEIDEPTETAFKFVPQAESTCFYKPPARKNSNEVDYSPIQCTPQSRFRHPSQIQPSMRPATTQAVSRPPSSYRYYHSSNSPAGLSHISERSKESYSASSGGGSSVKSSASSSSRRVTSLLRHHNYTPSPDNNVIDEELPTQHTDDDDDVKIKYTMDDDVDDDVSIHVTSTVDDVVVEMNLGDEDCTNMIQDNQTMAGDQTHQLRNNSTLWTTKYDEDATLLLNTTCTTKAKLVIIPDPWNEEEHSKIIQDNNEYSANSFYTISTNGPVIKKGLTGQMGQHQFTVGKKVASGGFATIYLAKRHSDDKEIAIKEENTRSLWEAHMLELAHHRLDEDRLKYLPQIHAAVTFSDKTLTLMDFYPNGTLLYWFNKCRYNNYQINIGIMALHMMEIIHSLHNIHIIHADIKLDNFMVINERRTSRGERIVELKLIDFGRSIDMKHYHENVAFTARSRTSSYECSQMLEGLPWNIHTDLFSLAASVYPLKYNNFLKPVKDAKTGKYRIPQRRIGDIWETFYDQLLNFPTPKDDEYVGLQHSPLPQLINLFKQHFSMT